MAQLEAYTPTGDDEIDGEWRTTLQRRFAAVTTERNTARSQLAALKTPSVPAPARPADELTLLAALPCTPLDLTLLPEEDQRQLYDAFHLQVRYNRAKHQVTLRVTINAATVDALAAAVAAAMDDAHHADAATGPPTAGNAPSGSHAGRNLPGAPTLTSGFAEALRSPASIVEQVVEQGSLT